MRQIDVLRNMFNTAPASIRKHIPNLTTRWDSLEVEKDHPEYKWIQNNSSAAYLLKQTHTKIRDKREHSQRNQDRLQKDLKGRNAQPNIDAVEHVLRTVDVPYKSNANLYQICVDVPGYEHYVTKGRTYHRHHWKFQIPVSYHKNVQRISDNRVHSVTENGDKWLNFITRYDQVPCAEPGTNMFTCLASAFIQEKGCQDERTGFYAEHQFDEEVYSAFAYTEKRALSLLNKRVKAAMLEKLGVA